MRRFGGAVLCVVILTGCSLAAAAQQSAPAKPASSSSKPEPEYSSSKAPVTQQSAPSTAGWESYCSAEAGFCLKYPTAWKKQAGVLEGGGVVVARPEQGQPEEVWPQITGAATLLPEEPEGKTAPEFGDVLNVMLDGIAPGVQKQTLQRTQTSAGGLPAELVKIKYTEPGARPWIEEGVFIDGDDTIYSIVLRCQPEQLAALEPMFEQVVRTWKLYEEPARK